MTLPLYYGNKSMENLMGNPLNQFLTTEIKKLQLKPKNNQV